MKSDEWKRPGRRLWVWLPGLAVALVLVGAGADDAWAQSGFDVNKTMDEAKGVGTVIPS